MKPNLSMKPYLSVATICLIAILTASASADHLDDLRRSYDFQRKEFTRDFHAQQAALRADYRYQREHLVADRKLISRIDCHETRARRLRSNSHALSALAKENGRRNRDLAKWYHDGLRSLRQEYDFARKNLRARGSYVNYAHPADCSCTSCVPVPAPVHHHPHDVGYRVGYDVSPVSHRKANGLDIAIAILSLLK